MTTTNDTLLVIGNGLKIHREYLVRSVSAHARSLGLDLVLINNLEPSWQREFFDEIAVDNVFDHAVLRARAREIATRRRVVGVVCTAEDAPTCDELLDAASARVDNDGHPLPPLVAGAGFGLPAGLLDVDQ